MEIRKNTSTSIPSVSNANKTSHSYVIVYRELDTNSLVFCEIVESDMKPVNHARSTIAKLAEARNTCMGYVILDSTLVHVYQSTHAPSSLRDGTWI